MNQKREEIKAPAPFGLKASDELLREIGRVFHKEKEVEQVILTERAKIAPDLERLRKKLAGKRVYIAAGGPLAYSIMALVKDLGMEVVGTSVWHHDQTFDNDDDRLNFLHFGVKNFGDFPVGVCNKQAFEVTNAIHKFKPDIAITRHIATIWAAKLGIPSIFAGNEPTEILYDGLIRFGQTIDDAAYSLGISKFLVNELGYFPLQQFITEDIPEEYKEPVASYFKNLAPEISAEVSFEQDGGIISQKISSTKHLTTPILLASTWEVDVAKEISALHLSVSLPIIDRLILNRTYLGYKGGLHLVEDIYSRLLAKHRE